MNVDQNMQFLQQMLKGTKGNTINIYVAETMTVGGNGESTPEPLCLPNEKGTMKLLPGVPKNGQFKEQLRSFLRMEHRGYRDKLEALEALALVVMAEECEGKMWLMARRFGVTYQKVKTRAKRYGTSVIVGSHRKRKGA